jgi:hypothetical protein
MMVKRALLYIHGLCKAAWSCSSRAWERAWPVSNRSLVAEDKIGLIVFVVVTGFCISVAFHYVVGQYLGKPWPATTFLNEPVARFSDFTLVVRQSAGLNPFAVDVGGFAGSPFAQLVGYLFSLVEPISLRLPIYLASFFAGFIPMVKQHLYGLKTRLTAHRALVLFAFVFLTYPVLFALDRANFDLLVCPILLLFAWAYHKERYMVAALLLALGIALKPYTAVFILVYAIDRRYRYAFLTAFTALFISVVSLSVFKDGLIVETQKYLSAISNIANHPSFGSDFVYTSDIFSGLTMLTKSITRAFNHPVYLPDHPSITMAYLLLAGAAALYLIVQLWRKPGPPWKKLAVLAILVVLLPINTHDYRLLYLFPAMLMFLVADKTSRHDPILVILWGLLLVPKNYWPLDSAEKIGMVVNPLLLIALLVCILPDAFSGRVLASTFRSACDRLRSTVHNRTSWG